VPFFKPAFFAFFLMQSCLFGSAITDTIYGNTVEVLQKPRFYEKSRILQCSRLEKILRKWTKKMSKNEIDEILLCKLDAALGNLRNFFGAKNTAPFMVW
jgi:hypothetical protein